MPATKFVLLIVLLATYSTATGQVVSYFRRDQGLADKEVPLPVNFDRPENVVWKQPLDSGHSTPCVFDDAIYLTTYRADTKELATVSLDRETGKPRWEQVTPARTIESLHEISSAATATPAADSERVYVFFGSYGLLAYNHAGELVWNKELGPFQDEYGAPSSPILVDGKLILNEDHDINNFLYAFDSSSGELAWQVPRDDFTRSYSTPVVLQRNGKTEVVVAGALQLVSYDIETGERLWWIDGLARIVNTTPIVVDDIVYAATWAPGGDSGQRITLETWSEASKQYDTNKDGLIVRDELPQGEVLTRFYRIDINQDQSLSQAEWERHAVVFERAKNSILAMRPTGSGNVTSASILWEYDRGIPYVPSPLVYRGIICMVKDGGIFTSLDKESGMVLKQGRLQAGGNYYASLAAGDGKIYIASQSGMLTTVSAAGDWKTLSTYDFGEPIYATPTIRDGRIYIRTASALYCFAEPERQQPQ